MAETDSSPDKLETDSSPDKIETQKGWIEDITTSAKQLFTKSNVVAVITFLGVYYILYFIIGKLFNKEENPAGFNLNLGRTLDILFFIILLGITYSMYNTYEKDPEAGIFEPLFKKLIEYVDAPVSAFTTGMFIIVFYLVAYLFNIPMSKESKSMAISVIESGAWLLLVIILFVDFFKYMLNIKIDDVLPVVDISGNEVVPVPAPTEPSLEKCEKEEVDDPDAEVFNVAHNSYTYNDAQAICKSFDSKLATYDQVEKAYNNGAEWCNYGWSEGQMILFPTQKNTWDELQKLDEKRDCNSKQPSRKNNCGRPGINGGYIANPYLKFGVNCFGKKQEASDKDVVRMNEKQNHVYPKTPEEKAMERKVAYWKTNSPDMLRLNSYNTTQWNKTGESPPEDPVAPVVTK